MPDSIVSFAPLHEGALHEATLSSLSSRIGTGRLSPVALVEALLERAGSLNPLLNAYLMITAERALESARLAEAEIAGGHCLGPLHGIPYGLKDIFSTSGIRTTGQSRVCAYAVPTEDAHSVAALEAAGGVLMGKLATHEFAHGGPSFDLAWPPARNPWDVARFTGGSSSGSGAAVAAGLVPAALGSDTGGSIRLPAAYCGIAGLKPTYGLVSRRGVYPNSFTFDHAGPMAWTAEDCAIILQAIAGHDPRDPGSANQPIPDYRAALTRDLKGLRLGVVRHFHEEDIQTDIAVVHAFDEAVAVMRELGATVDEVRLRPAKQYSDVKITIAESELFEVHAGALRSRPGDFGEDFLGRVLGAIFIAGSDYMAAQRERRTMLAEFGAVWRRFDAVLCPTTPGVAPRLGTWRTETFWQKASFTAPFNVSAGPALSVCMGFEAGLPLALQIAGRPFDDATVLRIGHAYELATPWRAVRPVLDPAILPPDLPGVPEPDNTLDEAERARAMDAVLRAGLQLTARQFDLVCAAAPHVAKMLARVRRPRRFDEEPANIFSVQ
jgi:aspartyl-tRNA(Asn)/glutamyl-tRNA(Gln) amidotransferase subunit A